MSFKIGDSERNDRPNAIADDTDDGSIHRLMQVVSNLTKHT
jgi:hypothetical protein